MEGRWRGGEEISVIHVGQYRIVFFLSLYWLAIRHLCSYHLYNYYTKITVVSVCVCECVTGGQWKLRCSKVRIAEVGHYSR